MIRLVPVALAVALLLVLLSPFCLGRPALPDHSAAWPGLSVSAAGQDITSTHRLFLPFLAYDHPVLRISALYYDSLVSHEPDEAFQLWNISDHTAYLSGYQISDGSRTVVFPTMTLAAGTGLWCTRHAATFTVSFGFTPTCEYGPDDTDPAVPNLSGTPLRFANGGGQIRLLNSSGRLVDVLVYENGDPDQPGWQGPAVDPYRPSNSFPAEGQILYRKFDWLTGQPLPDSDRRADWAQDPEDPFNGQRVRYPGWDLELFGRAQTIVASGTLTVALGPDNLFDVVSQTLASARQSIRMASYSFEHVRLAQLLAAKASQGVSVTVLLEGNPVGGIQDQERYVAQLIEDAGGQVWFMVSDRNQAHDRYTAQHAKYAIVDERLLLVSSENFVPDSMPDDDKSDGTLGRRGAALISDAPELVAHGLALFKADFDPAHHRDLYRWTAADPKYGTPPPGFTPVLETGGDAYQLVQAAPLAVSGVFTAEFVQAPETGLLPPQYGGLLGMVGRAGAGDTVLVEQLYERLHWGRAADTPQSAPNLRLAAYIDAARRGAQVRILLDAFFDHGDNAQTVTYLNQLALAEGLDLVARLGNPTAGGIHNKMVLVFRAHKDTTVEAGGAGSQGWVHVGSLNGSEAAAKLNRELALQIQSNPLYDYLATAFWQDWLDSGGAR